MFFLLESYYFCVLEANAKIRTHMTTPSGLLSPFVRPNMAYLGVRGVILPEKCAYIARGARLYCRKSQHLKFKIHII